MAVSWAEQLLRQNMGLCAGENVLVMTDEPLRPAGEALCAAARRLSAYEVEFGQLPRLGAPVSVVSRTLLGKVERAHVIVSLLSGLHLQHEPAVLRAARTVFREGGHGRWGYGAGLRTEREWAGALSADWRAVAERTRRVAGRLGGVSTVRIVSRAGTDLTFGLSGRPILADTGLLHRAGDYGNLPGGEAFVAPLETSAEGQVVIDLCLGDIPLDRPVTLTFKGGRAVSAHGGAAADELYARLGADPAHWTLGEFGIGTNASASPTGPVTVAEKALGTVHVALGGNRSFGGCNDAAGHYDCVIARPAVFLDGVPFGIE